MTHIIAPKEFYRDTARIAVPVAVQSLLSSCLGLVDTMMVSRIGMVTAVGTATQIDSMNTLLSLGATSGTAIFLAQYLGAGDGKNTKRTFGLSLLLATASGLLFFLLAALFPMELMRFYTRDSHTLLQAAAYLKIVKYSFVPASLAYAFSYAFRANQCAHIPLYVSTLKTLLNVLLNALLIFGWAGFPALGVQGAAIATVIAHWCGVLAYFVLALGSHQTFMGSFRQLFCPGLSFVKTVMGRIYALILNEVFFGFGETLYVKAFSTLGLSAMDAYFVGSKISSVFYILTMGISSAATVILGNILGTGNIEKAKETCRYFYGFAAILSLISAVAILLFAQPMVLLFGIRDSATVALAIQVVRVLAVKIALRLFIVISFSALRAGGDSKFLTFLDSGIMWLVGLPLTFFAVHVLQIPSIAAILLFIQLEHLARTLFGYHRLKSGRWAINLTASTA